MIAQFVSRQDEGRENPADGRNEIQNEPCLGREAGGLNGVLSGDESDECQKPRAQSRGQGGDHLGGEGLHGESDACGVNPGSVNPVFGAVRREHEHQGREETAEDGPEKAHDIEHHKIVEADKVGYDSREDTSQQGREIEMELVDSAKDKRYCDADCKSWSCAHNGHDRVDSLVAHGDSVEQRHERAADVGGVRDNHGDGEDEQIFVAEDEAHHGAELDLLFRGGGADSFSGREADGQHGREAHKAQKERDRKPASEGVPENRREHFADGDTEAGDDGCDDKGPDRAGQSSDSH